jgi:hypothetical protein
MAKILNYKDIQKATKAYLKAFDKAHPAIAEEIKRAENIRQYKDQTIMFWTLQLQFMGMSGCSLDQLYNSIRYSPTYVKNEFTRKLDDKVRDFNYIFTQEDIMCISTHLALQLSGLA